MSARRLCTRDAAAPLRIWVCVPGRFRSRLPATPGCFPSLVVPALPHSCLLLRDVFVSGRFRPQLPAAFPPFACCPGRLSRGLHVACGLWSARLQPFAAPHHPRPAGDRPDGCERATYARKRLFACRSVDSVGTDQTKSRAICTALRAAPLRIWSATHQKVSPLGEVRSRRMRPT